MVDYNSKQVSKSSVVSIYSKYTEILRSVLFWQMLLMRRIFFFFFWFFAQTVPITWIDAPLEQSAVAGLNYKVKCKVEANPAPEVSWARNGRRLGSEDSHFSYEGDGLVINQVQDSDDGSYSCEVVVSETGEYKKRDIHLEVRSPFYRGFAVA